MNGFSHGAQPILAHVRRPNSDSGLLETLLGGWTWAMSGIEAKFIALCNQVESVAQARTLAAI
jgi:hypothetical protein